MPAVSIILYLCNHDDQIVECLDSITGQTLNQIELIVICDGYEVKSLEAVRSYAKKDPRIIIITKLNVNFGQLMNCGIRCANGQYIGFINSCDSVTPTMCERLFFLAKKHDLDFIKSDYCSDKNKSSSYHASMWSGNYHNRVIEPQEEFMIFNLIRNNNIGLYKRSFLMEKNIEFSETFTITYQDIDFWFQVFSLAKRGYFLKEQCFFICETYEKSINKRNSTLFNVCEEYAYIYRFLLLHPDIKSRVMSLFSNLMYDSYIKELEFINDDSRDQLIKKIARDFSYYLSNGEFKRYYFTEDKWNNMEKLIGLYGFSNGVVWPSSSRRTYDYCRTLSPAYYIEELKNWFEYVTNRTLNIESPSTINDKIQWTKLYDSIPTKAKLTDKLAVRDWVAKHIGGQYLVPIFGYWNSVEEIDFEQLPDRFVLKCNHGSGWNYIITNKKATDLQKIKKTIDVWLRKQYGFMFGLECHYNLIEPKIIAEAYIENEGDLKDYKFICVDGHVEYIWVDSCRYSDHRRDIFDVKWNHIDCTLLYPNAEVVPIRPEKLEEMIDVAERLSVEFSFVRVDLYYNEGEIKFGEMTFTSSSGTEFFYPELLNYTIGQQIMLPIVDRPCLRPILSIIIPLHNKERTIRYTLNSVLRQKLNQIEIICIDNNSTDGTYKILQEYLNIDKRVQLYDQIDYDFSYSRYYGSMLSSGKYVMFLNQNYIIWDEDIFDELIYSDKSYQIHSKHCFKEFVGPQLLNKKENELELVGCKSDSITVKKEIIDKQRHILALFSEEELLNYFQ